MNHSSAPPVRRLPERVIRPSAAVVPWRRDPNGKLEIYWVRRAATLRFMAGWWAFPGGGVNRSDSGIAVHEVPRGIECTPPESAADDDDDAGPLAPNNAEGLAAAAIRELFEETGILAAVRDGRAAAAAPSRAELGELRRRLLERQISFPQMADQLALRPDAGRLVFAGRWTTPAFSAIRFDNRFFLFEWDAHHDSEPSVIPGELDCGEWIAPADALDRWSKGEALLAAPIVHILRVLADEGPEQGVSRLRQPTSRDLNPVHRFVFLPGLVMLPFRARTLPPATHTNAFLLGANRSILIDPGSDYPLETTTLAAMLEISANEGKGIEAIWLTHHHPDHVGSVNAIRRRFQIPVLAHAETASRLAAVGVDVDGELMDGQVVDLPGDPPTRVRALHTPGHARGHLCFHIESLNALIAGDMVSSVSTIVIDPPEGNMGDYLDSLARLEALNPATLFPSHGSATPYAAGTLRAVRLHRSQREQEILDVWNAGAREPAEIAAQVYGEIDAALRSIAERQIQAHLEHLGALGKI